jgi:tRNA pseudouridine38-40 synthase
LVLEYEGTRYHGWQIQDNGYTVQEALSDAIYKISGERTMPHGAGRTDAGVHALGQVASFLTNSRIPGERIADALNAYLPRNISVLDSRDVSLDFHPRKHARGKHYRYLVLNRSRRDVMFENRSWHYSAELDVEMMNKAGSTFVGTHDFTSFCASGHSVKTFERTIHKATWHRMGDLLVFDVEGSGFLYNMVRIMVGTLVDVGRGKIIDSDVRDILERKNRMLAGATAPADGLYMMKVFYNEEDYDTKLR